MSTTKAFFLPINTTPSQTGLDVLTGTQTQGKSALGIGGVTLGHSWERPAPNSVPAGAGFINTDDLTEQVSTGITAADGVAVSGWLQRLAGGFSAGRAGVTMGNSAKITALNVNVSGYTVNACTIAILFYWNGSVISGYNLDEIGSVGDSDNEARGTHLVYQKNGGNTDLLVYSGVATTLIASVNLLSNAVGYHALCVAPVNVAGTDKWRFSYDGSAVTDINMTASFVAPNSTDAVAAWSRGDGLIWLNGKGIDFMVWNSTLSNANILALATLPGTFTGGLPETASTGAATLRIQANRYDSSASAIPTRGIGKAATVAGVVTKVVL
jgi:hypothetical protein